MEQTADVRVWCEDATVHLVVTGTDIATTTLADTVAALGGDLRVDAKTAEATIPL